MIVIIKEQRGNYNKTSTREFKRKGIKYYLFIFSLKLYKVEYEVIKNEII